MCGHSLLWKHIKLQKPVLLGLTINYTLSVQAEPVECKFPHCLNPKSFQVQMAPETLCFTKFEVLSKLIIFYSYRADDADLD